MWFPFGTLVCERPRIQSSSPRLAETTAVVLTKEAKRNRLQVFERSPSLLVGPRNGTVE
jgi:hypothetical protein